MTALLYTFAGLGIFWTALVVGFSIVWWLASRAVKRDDAARERRADELDVSGLPLLDAAELLVVEHPDEIIWERR
jgi:hypothetical protein